MQPREGSPAASSSKIGTEGRNVAPRADRTPLGSDSHAATAWHRHAAYTDAS